MLDSEPAQPVQLLQLLVRILVNIVVMHHQAVQSTAGQAAEATDRGAGKALAVLMHWGGRRPAVISGNLPGHSRGMPVPMLSGEAQTAPLSLSSALRGNFEDISHAGLDYLSPEDHRRRFWVCQLVGEDRSFVWAY